MAARLTCSSLLVWLACGCALGPGPDADSDAAQEAPQAQMPAVVAQTACAEGPSYEELSAFNSCVACHASTKAGAARKAAPESINFDTEPAAKAAALRAVDMVKAGAMPPTSTGVKLSEVEKQELYNWAMCHG